jgi:predicted PurR-regulated permease PerM
MNRAVSTFLRGRLVISLIMSAMFAFGWSPLVTDVPFWLVFGIITGLLAIIPYAAALGWLAALLVKGVELATGNPTQLDWVLGLGGLSLVYGGVQLIEGWLLTPWIQGRAMDLSPVTVIIVVFIGGSVAGLWGMILAIPLSACIKIFLVDVAFPAARHWAGSH